MPLMGDIRVLDVFPKKKKGGSLAVEMASPTNLLSYLDLKGTHGGSRL